MTISEVNEAAKRSVRRKLKFSNRQDGSGDLAERITVVQGIQFLAKKGDWFNDEFQCALVRPGAELRDLFKKNTVRRLTGFPLLKNAKSKEVRKRTRTS